MLSQRAIRGDVRQLWPRHDTVRIRPMADGRPSLNDNLKIIIRHRPS